MGNYDFGKITQYSVLAGIFFMAGLFCLMQAAKLVPRSVWDAIEAEVEILILKPLRHPAVRGCGLTIIGILLLTAAVAFFLNAIQK